MSGLDSLSGSELSRLDAALKDDKFRALLADYARAISDPAIRRANEEALKQAELEAGIGKTTNTQSNNQSNKQSTKPSATKKPTEPVVQISNDDVD